MSTRFFIASGCGIATTTRYRCIHLQEQLQQLGFAAEVAEWFDDSKVDPVRPLDFDVLILYRLAFSPRLDRLISEARRLRKIVLFDTDDLIFEPELIGAHRGVKNLTSEDQVRHADGVRRYLATLEACDAAITATPLLAQLATTHGKRAFVHRNALGREMLALADELYAARGQRAAGEQIVLGYGSGTPTHDVDFLEAAGALARVLSRFPQVELWIVGPLKLSAALERREGARVHLFPATGWAEWFGVASQMDIAIAPLERDNIFCRAKSEV
ncbi:MAG TPA: hypothetical protein VGQ82_02845, partial [Chthoniobacterales bacterium]|nr:hypothetical protein [Chthoniobacterales bacterium]